MGGIPERRRTGHDQKNNHKKKRANKEEKNKGQIVRCRKFVGRHKEKAVRKNKLLKYGRGKGKMCEKV